VMTAAGHSNEATRKMVSIRTAKSNE